MSEQMMAWRFWKKQIDKITSTLRGHENISDEEYRFLMRSYTASYVALSPEEKEKINART